MSICFPSWSLPSIPGQRLASLSGSTPESLNPRSRPYPPGTGDLFILDLFSDHVARSTNWLSLISSLDTDMVGGESALKRNQRKVLHQKESWMLQKKSEVSTITFSQMEKYIFFFLDAKMTPGQDWKQSPLYWAFWILPFGGIAWKIYFWCGGLIEALVPLFAFFPVINFII